MEDDTHSHGKHDEGVHVGVVGPGHVKLVLEVDVCDALIREGDPDETIVEDLKKDQYSQIFVPPPKD